MGGPRSGRHWGSGGPYRTISFQDPRLRRATPPRLTTIPQTPIGECGYCLPPWLTGSVQTSYHLRGWHSVAEVLALIRANKVLERPIRVGNLEFRSGRIRLKSYRPRVRERPFGLSCYFFRLALQPQPGRVLLPALWREVEYQLTGQSLLLFWAPHRQCGMHLVPTSLGEAAHPPMLCPDSLADSIRSQGTDGEAEVQ